MAPRNCDVCPFFLDAIYMCRLTGKEVADTKEELKTCLLVKPITVTVREILKALNDCHNDESHCKYCFIRNKLQICKKEVCDFLINNIDKKTLDKEVEIDAEDED